MGIETEIAWTKSTFNTWWGCEKIDPGCKHCYADASARRWGHEIWGAGAPRRFFGDKHWAEPLKWNAKAKVTGEPWRVFCASMADVFEDRRDLDPWRDRLWALIEATPYLTWLLLTKRPGNHSMVPVAWQHGRAPKNIWFGATVADRAGLSRVPHLAAATWPAVRFLSMEPLLERVSLEVELDLLRVSEGWVRQARWQPQVDPRRLLVIAGGESGHHSRPMDLSWVRLLRDQARAAGAAFFMKQLGAVPTDGYSDVNVDAQFAPMEGMAGGGAVPRLYPIRNVKGGDVAEWPEDLRVREMPVVR